jgi:hypothetical protein
MFAPTPIEARSLDMTLTHLHQVELARRWKLSPRTLERWRWLGQGPQYLKIGGRIVYRVEDIEAYEADQIRTSTSAIAVAGR